MISTKGSAAAAAATAAAAAIAAAIAAAAAVSHAQHQPATGLLTDTDRVEPSGASQYPRAKKHSTGHR